MTIYVLLGTIGLPIFSGFTGGVGVVLAKSLGFLVGFILAAPTISYLNNRMIIKNEYIKLFTILVITNVLIYVLGGLYLALRLEINILAIFSSFTIYFIGDLIKIILAIFIYKRIGSHLKIYNVTDY